MIIEYYNEENKVVEKVMKIGKSKDIEESYVADKTLVINLTKNKNALNSINNISFYNLNSNKYSFDELLEAVLKIKTSEDFIRDNYNTIIFYTHDLNEVEKDDVRTTANVVKDVLFPEIQHVIYFSK